MAWCSAALRSVVVATVNARSGSGDALRLNTTKRDNLRRGGNGGDNDNNSDARRNDDDRGQKKVYLRPVMLLEG